MSCVCQRALPRRKEKKEQQKGLTGPPATTREQKEPQRFSAKTDQQRENKHKIKKSYGASRDDREQPEPAVFSKD